MRQVRQQRLTSLNNNKQNQFLSNNSNANMNLPSLRNNNKLSLKNQYHLNLHKRKKTFINLCTKRENMIRSNQAKNVGGAKKTVETSRHLSDHTLSSQMSGIYLSHRGDKGNYKTTSRPSNVQKYKILEKHEINSRMRAKMVDWLLEITQAYKCKNQTFFISIFLMDQYFRQCERSLAVSQLHLIGVTCIFMACKYQQIHPIRMKTIVKDIAHNKISSKEIAARQAEILHAIDFKFQRKCPYLLSQQIISSFNCFMPSDGSSTFKQNLQFYCRLMAFDCDLFRFENTELLSKGVILAAIRTMPDACKDLQLYDNFITSCGKQYESSHHICSQILFLNVNLKSQFGQLQNIQRMCPFKTSGKQMTQSCAL